MGAQSIPDPHAWQDVRNARLYVHTITQALQRIKPAEAGLLLARYKAYDGQLVALHNWIRLQFQNIPFASGQVLTTHDGFGYFEKAYGITFLAPWGLSTDVEPSPQMLRELLHKVRQRSISVLFLENMLNPQLMKEIAVQTGVKIGGTLYSDALSSSKGPASTYLAMMRHNVMTLKKGMIHSKN
jgi:zinc/manganese transport system substrate-binding protein